MTKAKEAAKWFDYQIKNGYQILTIKEYELEMIKHMCDYILKRRKK